MMFFGKRTEQDSSIYTAMDLGSNSFHLIVAKVEDGHVSIIDRLRESVQLAAAIDDEGYISDQGIERALDCLNRFSQRLRDIPSEYVRIVGTNTLRRSANGAEFLNKAQEITGHGIELISGLEEARITYLGVAKGMADDGGKRMVIDIGGSSTELIQGEKSTPHALASFNMGHITWSKKFFDAGKVTQKRFNKAVLAARLEMEPDENQYFCDDSIRIIGSSGTIRAIKKILKSTSTFEGFITLDDLKSIADKYISCEDQKMPKFKDVSSERAQMLPGGLAILVAMFQALNISRMEVSESAIREGLLFDLIGRVKHEDVRELTVQAMSKRFHVDEEQAGSVREMAAMLYRNVSDAWLLDEDALSLLCWAASLHEIGLSIAHNGHHKYGEYILQNADMPGFSWQEQILLSVIVRAHRKKINNNLFKSLSEELREIAIRLTIILRLAVIVNRNRKHAKIPNIDLKVDEAYLHLELAEDWINEHPLTMADLEQERTYLASLGYELHYTGEEQS